jgi:hypothetical protein
VKTVKNIGASQNEKYFDQLSDYWVVNNDYVPYF